MIEAVARWLVASSVQVGALALVVLALDLALARWARPAFRAALWLLVPLKLALPTTLSSPFSVARLVPEASVAGATVAVPGGAGAPSVAALALWAAVAWALAGASALREMRARRALAAASTGAVPERVLASARRAARLLGLRRVPRVRVGAGVGPAVYGVLRPTIVLPAALAEAGRGRRLEHVLLHELAHVRRGDALACLALRAAGVVHWFHPFAWLAWRRFAVLREHACDELAARALGGGAAGYRRTLLEIALARGAPGALGSAGALGFVPRRALIVRRLERLARPLPRRSGVRSAAGATLVALLFLCCVPLATPSAPAAPFRPPPLEELEGCLQRRFVVLGMLGSERGATTPSPGDIR